MKIVITAVFSCYVSKCMIIDTKLPVKNKKNKTEKNSPEISIRLTSSSAQSTFRRPLVIFTTAGRGKDGR